MEMVGVVAVVLALIVPISESGTVFVKTPIEMTTTNFVQHLVADSTPTNCEWPHCVKVTTSAVSKNNVNYKALFVIDIDK